MSLPWRWVAASPGTPPELFDYSMKEMNDRALAGADGEIGMMTDARWKDMDDAMQDAGALPAGLDYKAAYTLQFVDGMVAKRQ